VYVDYVAYFGHICNSYKELSNAINLCIDSSPTLYTLHARAMAWHVFWEHKLR